MERQGNQAEKESRHEARPVRVDDLPSLLADLNATVDRIWMLQAVLAYLRGILAAGIVYCDEIDWPEHAEISDRLLLDLKQRCGANVNLAEVWSREVGEESSEAELAGQQDNADQSVRELIALLHPDAKETTFELFREFRAVEACIKELASQPGVADRATELEATRARIDAMVDCFFPAPAA